MRHFSIFESNAYPPQNLIVGTSRIIERHPKKIQKAYLTGFFGAWIVYRRVYTKEEVGTLYQSNIHYELDDIPLIGFTFSKFAPIHSKSLLFGK